MTWPTSAGTPSRRSPNSSGLPNTSTPTGSHDLDEAGLVGVALHVDVDVGAVAEGRLAVEQLRSLCPPGILLRPRTVGRGRLLGFETSHGDEPAVLGDPPGRTEPAGCTGRQVLLPTVERLDESRWLR